MKYLIFFFMCIVFFQSCKAVCRTAQAWDDFFEDNKSRIFNVFKSYIGAFCNNFYKTVAENNQSPKENNVLSALSAHIVLSAIALGASTDTYEIMSEALILPRKTDHTQKLYKLLMTNFNTIKTTQFANSLFIDKRFLIKENYKKDVEETFGAETSLVKFADASTTAEKINNWVSQKTNNKIKDLVSAGTFSPSTAMFAVNTIYFNGQWKNKFNAYKGPFNNADGSVAQVQRMSKTDELSHCVLESGEVIEIPYKDDDLAMLIFKPNTNLAKFEKELLNMELEAIRKKFKPLEIFINMPKFTVKKKSM